MNISAMCDELKARYDVPPDASPEWTQARLDRLQTWRSTAEEIARETSDSMMDTATELASEMTELELRAARELHASYAPLLLDIIRQEWVQAGKPLDLDDCLGVSWQLLLRCLVDYDRDRAALSTHIYTSGGHHARQLILEMAPSHRVSTTQQGERLRRVVHRERQRLRQEKERQPTVEELVDAVRDKNYYLRETVSDATARDRVVDILQDGAARSLDAPSETHDEDEDTRLLDRLVAEDPLHDREALSDVVAEIGRAIGADVAVEVLVEDKDDDQADDQDDHQGQVDNSGGRTSATGIDWGRWDDMLGEVTDSDLADRIGCSRTAVLQRREELGIDPTSSRRDQLTDEEVREIWRAYHSDPSASYDDVADEMGESKQRVGRIIREDSYAAVDKPDPDSL